ncbi:alanine racemase [Porphyrobacter algicida]|uniref:alanine racemase n=1 Tax=Qipengyuania algicida TaxID=1836209 RepID=A0A845AFQ0_9SPHN|nr:alanine racemase [Qipengyuania algicida]MXP28454.1 alanine racemase [Qipengyuania algicida]
MTSLPPPSLRLDLDTGALASNWRVLDRMSGTAKAGAAIKADCYGLGAAQCLPILREAGARDFFVAHWSEVPGALAHCPPDEIAVLHGLMGRQDADFARQTGVRPVLNSLQQARLWHDAGGGVCHVMVDTGINRLGLAMDEIGDPILAKLGIDVLLSHLACADEDEPMNARQLDAFRKVIAKVPHRRASLANSAGIALGSDYGFDLTRPGLALYGGVPRPEMAGELRQVAYPKAALINIRQIEAGEGVGYNATFTAPKPICVGVVSLGYADGILRSWAGANLLSDDRALPILGKVSMDMIVIDLSAAPELKEGDWVELPYYLPDAAQQTSLSQYELLTLLGDRFRRDAV